MLCSKEPVYSNRHCFFEEEFGEDDEQDFSGKDGAPKVFTKPVDSPVRKRPNCEVEEIREAAPNAEEGSPDKQLPGLSFEEQQMQRLLDDFGFVKAKGTKKDAGRTGLGEAAYANSLDHSDLR